MDQIQEAYTSREKGRVEKLFCKKHKQGFPTKESLSAWYIDKLIEQELKCYYCETSIFDIRRLIDAGLLLPRKTGYGFRGPVLEIDRKINSKGYSPSNCVLSCYYCNNDKSYILEDEAYKTFFGRSRNAYFIHLLSKKL